MRVVSDIMTKEVRSISPDAPISELERELLGARVGGFPVVEDNRLVGVVSRSDIVRQLSLEQSRAESFSNFYDDSEPIARGLSEISEFIGRRLEKLRVSDIMARDPITVTSDTTVADAAALMVERRIHRLPVVDGVELVGVVSSMDFVRLVADGAYGSD